MRDTEIGKDYRKGLISSISHDLRTPLTTIKVFESFYRLDEARVTTIIKEEAAA